MKSKVYSSVEQFKEQNAELKTDLPISDDNSVLCQKVKIGNLELSNRLVCQAMEGCDGTSD